MVARTKNWVRPIPGILRGFDHAKKHAMLFEKAMDVYRTHHYDFGHSGDKLAGHRYGTTTQYAQA
jgi:hypothetical protein